jgi:hypothetical protein
MTNPAAEQGWSAVDLNGTGISMYPVPTEKMTNDVAQIFRDVRDGWQKLNGEIESLEGKLGDGPMGKPVREQYNPAVQQIRKHVPKTNKLLGKVSEAGTKSVPLYVEADLDASYQFGF